MRVALALDYTHAHSGFQHGSALTAGCFLPVLAGLLVATHRVELNFFLFDCAAQSPSLSKYLL